MSKASRKDAKALAQSVGKRHKFWGAQRLGAELAALTLRLEPSIDVRLGPLVGPHAGQNVAQVLAPVLKRAPDEGVKPSYVCKGGSSFWVGSDGDHRRIHLWLWPENIRRQRSSTIATSARACTSTETAPYGGARRNRTESISHFSLNRDDQELGAKLVMNQQIGDERGCNIIGQIGDDL